jgi:hypothetical protein
MYGTHADMTGGVCHATDIRLAAQYRTFLDKNFKHYLIICSLGAKNV